MTVLYAVVTIVSCVVIVVSLTVAGVNLWRIERNRKSIALNRQAIACYNRGDLEGGDVFRAQAKRVKIYGAFPSWFDR